MKPKLKPKEAMFSKVHFEVQPVILFFNLEKNYY